MKRCLFVISFSLALGGAAVGAVVDLATQTESPVVLGKTDILRYAGTEPLETSLVISNNAPSWTDKTSLTFTSVFDLQTNVTFKGNVWSGWTGFMKYGSGAMIIDGGTVLVNAGLGNKNVVRADYTKQINFSSTSETSPTQGFDAFCQAQGSIIVNSGTFTINQHAAYAQIGAWTAGEGEQEPDVLFEQNGGTTKVNDSLILGAYQGLKDYNTPNGPATSTLRVNGGSFTISGGKYLFVGPNGNALDHDTYNSKTRVEIHGGTLSASAATPCLRLYACKGTDVGIWIDGGTLTASTGFRASEASISSSSDGSQWISVCSNGLFQTTIGCLGYGSKNGIPLAINVFDGGRFQFNALKHIYTSKTTTILNVDGGVLGSYSSGVYTGGTNWISAGGIDVRVGAKGAILNVNHTLTRRVEVPIATAAGIAQDGGVVISNAANGVIEYAAAMAYNGPTVVKGGWLALADDGTVPGAVTVAKGGLMLRKAYSMPSLTLGAEGQSPAVALKVVEGSPLVVTDTLQILGTPQITVSLVDADGNDVTDEKTGIAVLTAPASAATALANLALAVDLSSGTTAYQKQVVVSGDTCSLVVDTVKAKRYNARWINPEGGNWSDGANWDGGEVPLSQAGVVVTFDVTSAGVNTLVHLPDSGSVTVGQINLASTTYGYRLTGGTLVFDNGGAGAGISNSACENAIDADLVLNEDLTVTGCGNKSKRLSFGGHQSGTGKVILPTNCRVGLMKEGFAPTAESCLVPNGGSYLYVPTTDIIGEGNNQVTIGGFTIGGTSTLTFILNGDSTLTITNGIRLADGVTSHTLNVNNYTGELIFGRTTDAVGTGPQSYLQTFNVEGRARLNSGTLSFNSIHNGDATGTIVFDGGTLSPRRSSAGYSIIRDEGTYILGARGLVIDTSAFDLPDASETGLAGATYTAYLMWPFTRDTTLAEGTDDGGITVTGGRGRVSLDGNIAGDWTGPFTLKPGTGLFVNAATSAVPSLVLGEAGATDYVELGVLTSATDGYGLIVSNALSVLSPVRCLTYADATAVAPTYEDGASYALLTYPAAAGDPDLTLFKRDVRTRTIKATYSIATLADDDSDYAGWRQLRMTIVVGHDLQDATWTATSAGGAWDESANWNGATPPNDATDHALFNAPEKAAVPVTLAARRDLGILEIAEPADATFGYAFSGAALALHGYLHIPLGVHTFGELAVADDLSLWTTNGVNTSVTAKLTGTGRLTVNAEHYKFGGLNVFDASDFHGKLTTGSGTTTINDLGFVSSVDDLVLSTGTLAFRPADGTAAETEIPGFITAGNVNYENTSSILDIPEGRTLAIRGAEASGTCGFVVRGNGTLRFKGTGSFVIGTQNVNSGAGTDSSDTPNSCGDAPRSAVRAFNVANGKVVIGTLADPTDAPTVTCGGDLTLAIASTSKDLAAPELEMNNGTLNISIFYLAYKNAVSSSDRVTKITLNGGTINCSSSVLAQEMNAPVQFTVNGGALNAKNLYTSRAKGSYGHLYITQNGGVCTFANVYTQYATSYAGLEPVDYIFNGGEFTCTGTFDFSRDEDAKQVRMMLSGGTFSYGTLALTATTFRNSRPEMRLNGGTMRPLAAATVSNVATLYVSTNATTLTTAGYASGDYEIAQALLTDPNLGGKTDGGLIKAGLNDLVLSAANTFTGPLVVQEGAVRLGTGGSLTGPVVLNGTTLAAPNGVSLAGLQGAGTISGSATAAALRPGSKDAAAFAITGDLALASTFTLDLGAVGTVAYGDKIPLCRVGGAVTLPTKVVVTNATTSSGKRVKAVLSVADGVLYATLTRRGLAIIYK